MAAIVVVAATVTAYLGGLPVPLHGRYADKALHFLLFGLLAFGWVLRWGDGRWRIGPLSIPKAIAVPLPIATVEEAAQSLSPHRNADPLDLLSDLAGLIVFWWLGRLASHRETR